VRTQNGAVYIERYIERPRHVEIPGLAMRTAIVFTWGKRMSIQRRHQKLWKRPRRRALPRLRIKWVPPPSRA